MATTPNQDNLQELVGIREQLLSNTDEINRQVSAMGKLGDQFRNVTNITKSLNSLFNESVKILSDENKTFITGDRIRKNRKKLEAEVNNIVATRKAQYNSLNEVTKREVNTAIHLNDKLKARNKEISELEKSISTENLTQQEILEKTERIYQLNQNNNISESKLISLMKNKQVLQSMLLRSQEEAGQAAVAFNIEAEKSNRWYKDLLTKVQSLAKGIGKSAIGKGILGALGIASTAQIFKTIVDTAFKLDNAFTSIGKTSGTTLEYTNHLLDSYNAIATSVVSYNGHLNKALISVTRMAEAQQQLQSYTDQMTLFTVKAAQDQVYLTKQVGLQVDEAANLNKLGMLSAKSADDVLQIAYEQTAQGNKFNGIRTKGLDVLRDVAKVEGALSVNYKNNPRLIAAAVVQAKQLGMNLEQAAKASDSLLDFESSIANELEAELLTGKKWNLEKARSLALDGDSAGAAAEMLKNVGSLAEFQKQNVIARRAEAAAVGMTSDELANALRSQELMKGVAKETLKAISESGDKAKYMAQLNAATNATEMRAASDRVSIQLKFEESMLKVQEAIGQMGAGPLLKLVNLFSKITENATALKGVLIGAAGLMAAIATSSILTALALTISTGGVAAILGGAALVSGGGMAYLLNANKSTPPTKTTGDGLISPTGQMLISTPEGGLVKPSKNDYLIATTNPGALLNGNSGGGSGAQERLLSAILDAVKKPGKVYMGPTEVGTTLGMSYSAYA